MLILDAAKAAAERHGFQVFPVAGKTPATPRGQHWADNTNTWGLPGWATATGFAIALDASTIVIDIDDLPTAAREGLPETDTLAVNTPRGLHLYFTAGAHSNQTLRPKGGQPIGDLKAKGGYVVYAGSTSTTGESYTLLHDAPISELTEAWSDWIDAHSSNPADPNVAAIYTEATAAEGGRNNYLTSFAGWLRGADATFQELLDALTSRNLSRCQPPLTNVEVEAIARSAMRFDTNPTLMAAREHRERIAEAMPTRFVTLADLINTPTPAALISNLLPAGLTVVYGAPGVYKSFICLDWASALADGRPLKEQQIPGRPVKAGRFMPSQPLKVCYIAGEGVGGFGKRALALGIEGSSLTIYRTAVNLLDADEADEFLAQLVAQQFDVIFIDTLRRAMTGGDENSVKDVGGLMSKLGAWSNLHGITSVLIHHAGKADGASYRGSSAIHGDCDNLIRITSEPRSLAARIITEKSKDSEPVTVGVILRQVTVHPPHDDNASTSLTITGYVELAEDDELPNPFALELEEAHNRAEDLMDVIAGLSSSNDAVAQVAAAKFADLAQLAKLRELNP